MLAVERFEIAAERLVDALRARAAPPRVVVLPPVETPSEPVLPAEQGTPCPDTDANPAEIPAQPPAIGAQWRLPLPETAIGTPVLAAVPAADAAPKSASADEAGVGPADPPRDIASEAPEQPPVPPDLASRPSLWQRAKAKIRKWLP